MTDQTDDFDALESEVLHIKKTVEQSETFTDPDQPTPEQVIIDDLKIAREKAMFAIGMLAGGVTQLWDYVEISEPIQIEGVERLTPVMLKHGGGELPTYLRWIPEYMDEIKLARWCAMTALAIRSQVIAHNEKAADENNADDTEGGKNGDK